MPNWPQPWIQAAASLYLLRVKQHHRPACLLARSGPSRTPAAPVPSWSVRPAGRGCARSGRVSRPRAGRRGPPPWNRPEVRSDWPQLPAHPPPEIVTDPGPARAH